MGGNATLPDLLGAAAVAGPERTAVEVDGLPPLTYGAWQRRSDALARGLQGDGVTPGQRVVLLFDADHWGEYAVAYVAAQKAAAVPVPLDARVGGMELARILRDCDASAIVAPPGYPQEAVAVRVLRPADLEEAPHHRAGGLPDRPHALAEVLYASRPLAPPVAVPRSHRALLTGPALVEGSGAQSVVHALPVGSLAGQDALRACLSPGRAGSLVLAAFEPDRFCALLSAAPGRAGVLHPATAQAVLASGAGARHDLSRVPRLVLASGRVSSALLRDVARTFRAAAVLLVDVLGHGPAGPGPAGRASGARSAFLHDPSRPACLGRPHQGTVVWAGDEHGERLDPGAVGRVWLRAEQGAVDTGDLGFVDDEGRLHPIARPTKGRDPHLSRPSTAGVATDRTDPTPTEATVAAIWERVLERRQVGPGEDFFDLGGDAFAATTVLSLVEDAVGTRVPLAAFLEAPTVAGLAAAVEQRRPSVGGPPAPVAFSQEGMLWHEHFAPGCQNLPGLARRYRGPLDIDALTRALDEIVRRHEALRTTFALRDLRLVQIVRPHRPLRLPVRDLTGLSASERDVTVERLVAEAGRHPFDLVSDAVFQPSLLRLAEDDHVLVLRTHHSVFDDWSVGVFRRELATLYTAFRDGQPSPLAELPLQLGDFARQQRRDLAGPTGTREMRFWRRELAGAPLATQLAVDDPDQPAGSAQRAGEPISVTFAPELHEGLRALARAERATVFMTMLAAYGALVHRYTGQDDLLLATVVANRNRTELEGLVGCFTKKVPLRLRLGGDPTFTEALARTRGALMGALTHQDLPFEAVVQDVLGPPAASHGLVPQVALMFQGETPRHELHLPGVETAGFETSTTARRAHFMAGEDNDGDGSLPDEPWGAGLYLGTFVIVSVAESPDRLSCVARGAFHGPAVRELLESFEVLLAGVVADPARRLSQLPLLHDRARAEIRARSRGPSEPPPAGTLHAAFAARVRRTPHAPAVRTRDETLTFAELDARSVRLAHRLRAVDVAPGASVGVCLDLSAHLVVAVLATWKAGAAWVALDPDDADDRLARIVEEAALRVVIADDAPGVLARSTQVVAAEAGGGTPVPEALPAAGAPGDPAVVFYGSGPSAVPRGVVLGHGGVLNLLSGLRGEVHRSSRADPRGLGGRVVLCPHPTADGFLRQFVALIDGHTVRIPDRPAAADPHATVSLVGSAQVDVLDCTPSEFASLLDAGLAEALLRRGTAATELALVVGTRAAAGPELWRTLRALAGVRAAVVYGPPECAFAATLGTATGAAARPTGAPLANVGSYVLGGNGQLVPHRAVGELHLGGPSLARGYLGGPETAAEGFRAGTAGEVAERLYATGHRARRLPDGTVELLGRVDDDTDLRGFAVDPSRVRAALAGCRGVRQVDVTLHRDERGEPRLLAHVVPDGQPATLDDLRLRLWTRLPGYAWPAGMVVASRPAPAPEDGGARVPDEQALSALWAEVLGTDHVGAGHNYWQRFSFLEALARAREAGLSVPAESITRNRTVATLAADRTAARRPEAHPQQGAR